MKRTLLVAALAATALTGSSCAGDGTGTHSSMAKVLLTDAPFPFDTVQRVDVYVVRIDASTMADTSGGQEWTNILTPKQRFNLLDLQQGTIAVLGEADAPTATWAAVRLVINTDSSGIYYSDGSEAGVRWPLSGELALHALVEQPLALYADGNPDVVIDFDVGQSFAYQLPGDSAIAYPDFVFLPVIRAVVSAATGGIMGVVRGDVNGDGTLEPIKNATVVAYRGNPAAGVVYWSSIASGATDADGRYRIAYLAGGTYIVQASPPAAIPLAAATVSTVEVSPGSEATLDINLNAAAATDLNILGPDELNVGQDIVLRAAVIDANGDTLSGQPVAWSWYPPSLVTVTSLQGGAPTGEYVRVHGNQMGLLSVSAAGFGLYDSTGIAVKDPNALPVATVTLSPASLTMNVHDSTAVEATLRDANGAVLTGRSVTWAVSDTTVLLLAYSSNTVTHLIALKAGSATLTATSEGKSGSASVTVNP